MRMLPEAMRSTTASGSGRFSDDLSGTKKTWKNLGLPTSELGEASTGVLVTLVFAGPKNTESSRALARDMAQVTVLIAGRTYRAYRELLDSPRWR